MPERRTVTIIVGVGAAVVAAVSAAHLAVLARGPDHRGPLLLLDHLFDLVAVGLLFLVSAAVGVRLLRFLRLPPLGAAERLLFATAGGAGVVGTCLLGLGLVGVLTPAGIAILFGGLVVAGAGTASELVALLRELPRTLARPGGSAGTAGARPSGRDEGVLPRRAALAAVAVLAVVMVGIAAAPPTDWDSLAYHLYEPGLYLEAGRIFLPVDSLHGAFVGLAQLLYLPFLAVGSSSGPALLSVVAGLLLTLAVLAFCDRFLDADSAALSAILLWGSPVLLLVAVTPRVDVTLALYLFLAHYALLLALSASPDAETRRGTLVLGGLLLGLAFGVKLQAAPYILGLVPLAVWAARADGWSGAPSRLAAPVALGLAAALPWALKNWLLVGDPLYPLLSGPTLEPWLAGMSAAGPEAPSIDGGLLGWIWSVREPFNLPDFFRSPEALTVEGEAHLYVASPLLALLPLALLRWRDRAVLWLLVPSLLCVALTLLPQPRTNLRYLIPPLVPLTVAAVAGIVAGLGALRRAVEDASIRRLRRPALLAVAAVGLLPTGRAVAERLSRAPFAEHAAGFVSREAFLAEHADPAVSALNRVAPALGGGEAGDRTLLLWESRAMWLDADVIRDTRGTNWPVLAALADPDRCLPRADATHVLVNVGALDYWLDRGLEPETVRLPALQRFIDRCLEPTHREAGFLLYRLRDAPEPPASGG